MSAVGDARKRTQQTPAGTLTDTERDALVVAERRGSVRLTVERIVAARERAAVAAALAPIEALAESLDERADEYVVQEMVLTSEVVRRCADDLRAALAGGGDRG